MKLGIRFNEIVKRLHNGAYGVSHDTWFMRPNHERAPVMSVGVGKFLMASRIFDDGVILVGVIVSLANGIVSQQN